MCVQEEITQGVVSLSVETGKMTAICSKSCERCWRRCRRSPPSAAYTRENRPCTSSNSMGLLTNIEITEQNIKAFSAVAKKYDIDYALKKDPTNRPTALLCVLQGEG